MLIFRQDSDNQIYLKSVKNVTKSMNLSIENENRFFDLPTFLLVLQTIFSWHERMNFLIWFNTNF